MVRGSKIPKSFIAYLGIGSNLGNRKENCIEAIRLLEESPFISVTRISSLYETEPVGYKDQRSFINCVVEVETTLEPDRLLKICKGIEGSLGREKGIPGGPRTLDIDILLYSNQVVDEKELRIPHPLMHERRFVLVPLSEIAPHFIHPIKRKKIGDILKELKDTHPVRRLYGNNI